MQANPPVQPSPWDDEIDLRELIETLLRKKWLIIGLVAASVLLAGVYSFFVATPRYESTIVVSLPDGQPYGMTSQRYERFSVSAGVLRRAIEAGSLDMSVEQLGRRLQVRLEGDTRMMQVTAHGSTPDEAYGLVVAWHEAFQSGLTQYAQEYIGRQLQAATDNLRDAETKMLAATRDVSEFEREHALSVKEARLHRWESELIRIQADRDDLQKQSIPSEKGRVENLETLLASTERTLGGVDGGVIVPDGAGVPVTFSSGVAILNPVYLELSQELIRAQSRLAMYELQADLLELRLSELPGEINELEQELTELRAELVRLRNEATSAEKLHRDMFDNFQRLSALNSNLGTETSVTTVAEPLVPESPVAPRKMLNVALAAVLGGFVGVGAAFFQHFWENSAPAREG